MRLFSGLFIFVLVLAASTGMAAKPDQQLPKPQLPSGDFFATVAVSKKSETGSPGNDKENKPDASKDASEEVRTITIKKIGQKILYQIAWSSGKSTAAWRDVEKGIRMEQAPNGVVNIVRREPNVLPSFAALDSESIDWIQKKDAVAEETVEGRKCIHYRQVMVFSESGDPEDRYERLYQAWIDQETGLPVILEDGIRIYKIAFAAEPPAGNLVIPAEFQKEIDRFTKALRAPSYLQPAR